MSEHLPKHPQSILTSLMVAYEKSLSARQDTLRDYTIDYEKFLRSSAVADGDEREIAERELRLAAANSHGHFRIDLHRRTGQPERIRLARDGGEAWLYQQLDQKSPHQLRAELAEFLREASQTSVPRQWQESWTAWFLQLAHAARHGSTIQPYLRDDPTANHALTHALHGILHWSSPALIRYASTAICGDSKALQRLAPRLRPALLAITGSDSFENFGILPKPRSVTFHGPISLHIGDHVTHFASFPGPIALAETNLTADARITTTATLCLTVENEDTFHELAAANPGIILIQTSFAGAAVIRIIKLLPAHLTFYHFGDSDPAGADILRDLREKSSRDICPLIIAAHPHKPRQTLGELDRKTLQRLLHSPLPAALRTHVEELIEHGIPSDFEQESIPIEKVWSALSTLHNHAHPT